MHKILKKLGARDKQKKAADENVEVVDTVENAEPMLVHPLADDPDRAWLDMKLDDAIRPAEIPQCFPQHKSSRVRFVCISDTHAIIEHMHDIRIPEGDVLLHCGDFTLGGVISQVRRFNDFIGRLPHRYKVVIAGNHDEVFDSRKVSSKLYDHLQKTYDCNKPSDLLSNCIYLQDEMVEIMGIKIYGTPWVPAYYTNGFALERGQELLDMWNQIPPNIDILMTHCPPLGAGDLTSGKGIHVGCVDLMNVVQHRVKPQYHVFGHIHEGYGIYSDGTTTFINASSCNRKYQLVNKPVVFDFDIPKGHKSDASSSSKSSKKFKTL